MLFFKEQPWGALFARNLRLGRFRGHQSVFHGVRGAIRRSVPWRRAILRRLRESTAPRDSDPHDRRNGQPPPAFRLYSTMCERWPAHLPCAEFSTVLPRGSWPNAPPIPRRLGSRVCHIARAACGTARQRRNRSCPLREIALVKSTPLRPRPAGRRRTLSGAAETQVSPLQYASGRQLPPRLESSPHSEPATKDAIP